MKLKTYMVSSKYAAYTASMSAQQYSAVLFIYTRVKSTFGKEAEMQKRLLNLSKNLGMLSIEGRDIWDLEQEKLNTKRNKDLYYNLFCRYKA